MRASTLPFKPATAVRGQRGLTLIEILVAITIALVLVGGMLTLFSVVKRTFLDQNQLAGLQDRERLAMTVIANSVQRAGYWPNPDVQTATQALPASGDFTVAGQAITGTTGATATGDTLEIRFLSSKTDGVIDCTGATTTSATAVITTNVLSVDATGQLNCAPNGGAAVALVSGIQSMTVAYGVDTNADGSVDSYVPASTVTANNWWSNVLSARISLTFANPLASQSGQPATLVFSRVISLMSQT